MDRDEDVRAACFLALDVLRAKFGLDVPYAGGLADGFPFRGVRVAFLNRQKGIHRSAAQRGPAALAIVTSVDSPYGDRVTPDGVVYAYRAGSVDLADNRALRAACTLQVPLVYFVGTRRGHYEPIYPSYVVEDDPATRSVLVTFGRMIGPLDEREPIQVESAIERRYVVRETLARLHQGRFRGQVITAYREQCAICRLKEVRLLDAAHIRSDRDLGGIAAVSNGLSLCTIHHRAYDQDLVGIAPDYRVHVARRLLDDDDGPMLDLLKGFHGASIELPRRRAAQPDRELLADRFARFGVAA